MIKPKHALAAFLIFAGLSQMPTFAQPADSPEKTVEKEKEKEKTEAELLREEKDLLSARYDLLMQQQRNQMVEMELEKQRMAKEAELRQARQAEEAYTLKTELERLQTAASLKQARQDAQLAEIKSAVAAINADKQLADAEREKELGAMRAESSKLAAENALRGARIEQSNLELQELHAASQAQLAKLKKTLELREAKDKSVEVVLDDIEYARNPFRDGTLYVSDRRIALNGPIISGTADWVTNRIHYFNNQSSELPIFIVIDNCPGGSVMQGYRIVKAIEESPAPVHVVVKSFAASMAAIITTLADHSYAYPNAIILHHQMSSGLFGNMTQMAEQLDSAYEWERRLALPVAEKMGVSIEKFREMMYENDSNGDWDEFADGAKELRWVNHIVQEVREDGIRKQPKGSAPRPWFFIFFGEDSDASREAAMNAIKHDEKGVPYMQLPPLGPFDHYFLFDRNNFYRY